MTRFALLLPLTACLVFASFAADAEALLKMRSAVDADVVRLGDLFDNLAPEKAQIAVARAPMPGRRSVADAEWLQKIANANGVSWRPAGAFDQVVIERSGVVVARDQIEAEIRLALDGQDLPQGASVELSNRAIQMVAPANDPRIGVRDLTYDAKFKRFSATIEIPADTPNAQRMQVSGRVFSTVEVPVLARSINRGETIGARDLSWQRVRDDGLRRDILLDVDQIIGMTPKQSLRPGQMIALSDIQKPVAVERNAMVTMILKSGAMSLSAQGRSLEQGSVGDIVRVTNTRSNTTVEGRVEGANLVVIVPNGGLAMAN